MAGERASRADVVGAWLRNAALVALIAFLGMCGWFVYRLSRVAYGVEQAVAGVSEDVQEVTATVATLCGDVAAMRTEIVALKAKAEDSVPYDEVESAFEEALALGQAMKADSSALPPAAEAEIAALLKSLTTSGCTAEVGGRKQSVFTLHARLYTKYRLKQNTLTSVEDFIDQVATASMLGKTYYLVDKSGQRVELAAWLRDQLATIRAAKAP
jgi:hypothetical protein